MNTSEAVFELRKRLKLSREDFAEHLGVSSRTVYRLESGQAPTTKTLLVLAEMARNAGLKAFADLFEATRRTNISARVKRVSASNLARRVTSAELGRWAASVEEDIGHLNTALDWLAKGSPVDSGVLWLILGHQRRLLEDIELYIAGADKPGEITWERIQKLEDVKNAARKKGRK
jgi:transcriptional regulator with XRE-family HTH domain